jgi:hypothetical protein
MLLLIVLTPENFRTDSEVAGSLYRPNSAGAGGKNTRSRRSFSARPVRAII